LNARTQVARDLTFFRRSILSPRTDTNQAQRTHDGVPPRTKEVAALDHPLARGFATIIAIQD